MTKKMIFTTLAVLGLALSPSLSFAGDDHEHGSGDKKCSGEEKCGEGKCGGDNKCGDGKDKKAHDEEHGEKKCGAEKH